MTPKKFMVLLAIAVLLAGIVIGGQFVMPSKEETTEWQIFKNQVSEKIDQYLSQNDLDQEGWEDKFSRFLHSELDKIPKYEELCSGWNVNFKPEDDDAKVHIDFAERPIYKWHRIVIKK
jgi:hypothetical protein